MTTELLFIIPLLENRRTTLWVKISSRAPVEVSKEKSAAVCVVAKSVQYILDNREPNLSSSILATVPDVTNDYDPAELGNGGISR